MTDEVWAAVDQYVTETLVRPEASLQAALEANLTAELPAIDVSPPFGKLLRLLAETLGASRILEIGTLGGYSTIWLAQSLPPDGRLISLEVDARHAEIARANIARAGLASVVEVRVGRAIELLPQLETEGAGPFDVVFIDADKTNTAEYFSWALRLSRPGSLIVIDNVVRKGAILDAQSADENVQGMRRFFEKVATTPGVSASGLQTVGSKGYDGFAIIRVSGNMAGA